MASSPNRRRERTVRVTVAAALLAVATIVVLVALPTQSPTWLSASSVFALVGGITASRITYTETLQSRRENAADRAAQAQAYREMFSTRACEHAEFTAMMTARLANRDRSIRELEGAVALAEGRFAELQEALEIKRAEEADELALWDGWEGSLDTGPVVDLLAEKERG